MEYIIPKSVEDIKEIISDYKAYYIAGGTDIMVLKKNSALQDWPWVDISVLKELEGIYQEDGYINIGSLTTMSEIARNPVINEKAKALSDAAGLMGSPLIRNLATIGGNLAISNPAGDAIPPLCALDASLILQKGSVKREVPADEFCLGPGENMLVSGEIIINIRVPVLDGSNSGFMKLGPRNALAISKVSVAAWWVMDEENIKDIRIFMGAVGPKCMRAIRTEELICGERLFPEMLEEVSRTIQYETSPIDDFRSTKEYRRKMTGVLLKRILGK